MHILLVLLRYLMQLCKHLDFKSCRSLSFEMRREFKMKLHKKLQIVRSLVFTSVQSRSRVIMKNFHHYSLGKRRNNIAFVQLIKMFPEVKATQNIQPWSVSMSETSKLCSGGEGSLLYRWETLHTCIRVYGKSYHNCFFFIQKKQNESKERQWSRWTLLLNRLEISLIIF